MKKILYVSDATSIHTKRWAKYYRDQNFTVHIASFRDASIDGVTLHQLPTFGLGKLGYFFAIPRLRKIIDAFKPDIIHAQYVTSYGFIAAAAGSGPLIVTAWGSDVLISPKKSFLLRKIAQYALRKAKVITTVAEHMNKAVSDLGINPKSIQAIPFGVDTDLFSFSEKKQSQTLRIISTRNFAPIYDIATLINAFHLCSKKNLHFKVDLVGDGALREDILKQIAELNLSDRITVHGHVQHSQLVQLLQNADIFITSALSDGNNVSLNEAMACGSFPIATDIPANAQWITNQKNGLLYSPGNAEALAHCIGQAIFDYEFRKSCAIFNREMVEQRADWKVLTAKMTNLYNKVASNA